MTDATSIFNAIEDGKTSILKQTLVDLIERSSELPQGSDNKNIVIQVHPLGFLCLRWNLGGGRTLRVHVWDKKFDCVQNPNWPIHDHVFSFRSFVVAGAVQNKTYSRTENRGDKCWDIYSVAYGNGVSKLVWTGIKYGIGLANCVLQTAGTYYDVPAGVLHRSILRSEFALTVLATRQQGPSNLAPNVVGGPRQNEIVFDRASTTEHDVKGLLAYAIARLA
jgi:hypothetical protein